MSQSPKDPKVNQSVNRSNNVTQVGGNYGNTATFNIWFLLIGVLALGGLAWALVVGFNHGGQNLQPGQEQTTPTPSQSPT